MKAVILAGGKWHKTVSNNKAYKQAFSSHLQQAHDLLSHFLSYAFKD